MIGYEEEYRSDTIHTKQPYNYIETLDNNIGLFHDANNNLFKYDVKAMQSNSDKFIKEQKYITRIDSLSIKLN